MLLLVMVAIATDCATATALFATVSDTDIATANAFPSATDSANF